MQNNFSVDIPEGLNRKLLELFEKYDVTIQQLVKGVLRNTVWYERNYHRLPGNRSVTEKGEVEDPKPRNVIERVVNAVKGTDL